jgi:hypothetical protein
MQFRDANAIASRAAGIHDIVEAINIFNGRFTVGGVLFGTGGREYRFPSVAESS